MAPSPSSLTADPSEVLPARAVPPLVVWSVGVPPEPFAHLNAVTFFTVSVAVPKHVASRADYHDLGVLLLDVMVLRSAGVARGSGFSYPPETRVLLDRTRTCRFLAFSRLPSGGLAL